MYVCMYIINIWHASVYMTHTFTLMYTYKDIHMQGSRLNFVLWSFPLLTTTNSFAWHNLWPSSAKWCRRSLCLKRWIVCRDTGMPLNQTSRRALAAGRGDKGNPFQATGFQTHLAGQNSNLTRFLNSSSLKTRVLVTILKSQLYSCCINHIE